MKPTGCIRCGAAGSHVLHPLELVACDDCAHAWLAEESLSQATVAEAVGGGWLKGESYAAYVKRFDAELLKRTLEWAKAHREAA